MVLYLGISILIVLLGCAPNSILLDQQTKESLSAIQEIKVLYYESPAPVVPIPQGGGVLDIVAAAAETHREHLDKMGLEDPILHVKKGFLPSMQTSLPKTTLSEFSHPLPDDDLQKLKRELGQGYLLDFKTTKWGILNNAMQGYSFAVYHSRARLVNLSEEKIIWQGVCYLVENDPIARPSILDFEADNGTLFKAYLAKLTASCVAELNRQFTETSASK
jgi:hypothetical protein